MENIVRCRGWQGVGAVLLWACAMGAWAQTPVRIGVTKIVSHAALDADEKGFKAGLESSGFKEGVHVVYDRQNAQGDPKQAEAIARKFVADKVGLIHAISTPSAQAVVKATKTIPVVFSSITDPISAGIVPPQSKPGQKTGTHVTGVSDLWPVFLQMQTYAQLAPQAKTWGTVYNPAEANSMMHIQAMRDAATRLKLKLVEAKVSSSAEVEAAALGLVGQKVQAFTITSDNTTVANLEALVRVAEQHKVPLFAGDVDSVHRGAIAAFGMDYFLVGYAAGKKAALILKGIKPGDIPWGPMEKFSLVINTRAAQAQGLTLSPDQLRRADKVLN